jgi:hypothetical protein
MNLRLGALLNPKYTLLQSYIHTKETITVQIQTAKLTLSYGIKTFHCRCNEHKHEKISFGRQHGQATKMKNSINSGWNTELWTLSGASQI